MAIVTSTKQRFPLKKLSLTTERLADMSASLYLFCQQALHMCCQLTFVSKLTLPRDWECPHFDDVGENERQQQSPILDDGESHSNLSGRILTFPLGLWELLVETPSEEVSRTLFLISQAQISGSRAGKSFLYGLR